MFPDRFQYLRAGSVAEAVTALVEGGYDAKIIAGGQSLVPMMKLRLATPGILIDLSRLDSLSYIDPGADAFRIGALTTESQLERSREVQQTLPILVDTSSVIADPLVRNLATVGGNVAHGDPANDHPATMIAVGAGFTLQGPGGTRTVAAEDFFLDFFTTALEPEEILTSISIPRPNPGTGSAYVKHERQVGDYAIAGAAVSFRIQGGVIRDPKIALTNLGSTPVRPGEAEQMLEGRSADGALRTEVGRAAAGAVDAWADSRGSAEYRRRVTADVTARAVERAWNRAGGGHGG